MLDEIAGDLKSTQAMGRMVQGDVGCGKTALAFGAIALTAQAGYQSALMAPTEILARQHLESAKAILEPLGIPCGLLVGGIKAKERRDALENIASGEWQAVIGTHALISEGVEYKNLGLVVTDEQHRFGVRQRRMLSKKAVSAEEKKAERRSRIRITGIIHRASGSKINHHTPCKVINCIIYVSYRLVKSGGT